MIEHLTLAAVMAGALLQASTSAAPADRETVWVLSGQSNAGGKPPDTFTPPVDEDVQWFNPETQAFAPVSGDLTGMVVHRYSPFHTAAYEVAQSGARVKMLGYAKSGAPIRHWLERDASDPEPNGLDRLQQLIVKGGIGANVFIWDQGGADRQMDPEKYKDAVAELVRRVREAAQNPQMLIVVVQSGGRGGRWAPGRIHVIREAQRRFVVEDGNAVLVPAIGRGTVDGGHLTAESQAEIGREIGHAILRSRFERGDTGWPGPVLDQSVATEDGTSVIAHFAEAEQLSGADPREFKVTDESGEIRCTAAAVAKTLVTLTLERAIVGEAQLGYACEGDPPALLRDEAGYRAPAVVIPVRRGKAPSDEPTATPNGAGLK